MTTTATSNRSLPVFAPSLGDETFATALSSRGMPELRRGGVRTLQVNVGRLCNIACHHCHVEAGPKRTEQMTAEVADRLIDLLAASPNVELFDLTGGAPEMNEHFRRLVVAARQLGRRVMDRCNLTILLEPGYEDLADFLAQNEVEVVASLPCYTSENVESQRGKGVFDASIEGIRQLNALGYGRQDSSLPLDLVYNPLGPSLPPDQEGLERDYKRELGERFGLEFRHLLTLTNMPIRRFADQLERLGQTESYQALLVNHFNPDTVEGLMCRSQVSIDWHGDLYDCDFNLMLGLAPPGSDSETPLTIWDIDSLDDLAETAIATAHHCFGCTAGAGSSCSGALA